MVELEDMTNETKQYGLILPSKNKNSQNYGMRTLNPLVTSDDELERDEDEPALNWVEASLKKSSSNSGQKSLQKRILKEALEQDTTVFQYDEVFDDMKASQQKQREKSSSFGKKPKYIETIIKHCEKRKLENERRLERKVQKEREAEGDEFADKESFVTPAYLKKLKELKEAEEAEKKEKVLEEMQDVHKHKNFGVFYHHLFKQRVGDSEVKQEPPNENASDCGSTVHTEPSFARNRTDQRSNIRARMSEDESPQRNLQNIKTEPRGSSEEDGTGSKNSGEHKLGARRADSDESRSISRSPERKRFRDRPREISREHRHNSRDGIREELAVRERRRERSTSRHRESTSKGQNRKYRSRSRSPKVRSKSPERKSAQKGLDRRDLPKRNGAKDAKRKDRSKSGNRGRKEKGKDRTKKDKLRDQEKEERNGKMRRNNSARDKENKDESASNKAQKEATDPQTKQNINTTLGMTDVNKMKIEDRIKRFLEIFAKRTVGQTYEKSLQKYFERKAVRDAAGLL